MSFSGVFNVGPNPIGSVSTPDGKLIYVCNNNVTSIPNAGGISVLDVSTGVTKLTISDTSFVSPHAIASDRNGKRMYVTNSGGTTVSIIDTNTNIVIGVIPDFDGPTGIVLSKTNGYVCNFGAGLNSGLGTTISVFDLATSLITTTITVALAPIALTLSCCGKYLYVVSYVDGTIGSGVLSVIQLSNNSVINTTPGFFGPFSIALTQKGDYAYVSNFGNNDFKSYGTNVIIVDLKKFKIVKVLETGIQPCGLVISKKYAYVGNGNSPNNTGFTNLIPGRGTISVINLKNKRVEKTFLTEQMPSFLLLLGDNLYVSNYFSNVVTKFCLS